jgi:hypothetical protein
MNNQTIFKRKATDVRLCKSHLVAHLIARDNQIIIELEQLKSEARERKDEPTAQRIDGIIFQLLCLTKEI